MPDGLVNSTIVPAGTCLYRITSPTFKTGNTADYPKVVNGQGPKHTRSGARYNNRGKVPTVYLAEDPHTCLAEKMFYFYKEFIHALDAFDRDLRRGLNPPVPPYNKNAVLWEITFQQDILHVAELNQSTAGSFLIWPLFMTNPSQDYDHLREGREEIEYRGYRGLKAASSRSKSGGNMIVLFDDQSSNVASIDPYDVEFRLVQSTGGSFFNHTTQILDFNAGEVLISNTPKPAGRWLTGYSGWTRVEFNR